MVYLQFLPFDAHEVVMVITAREFLEMCLVEAPYRKVHGYVHQHY
jgi:hypothetical protein